MQLHLPDYFVYLREHKSRPPTPKTMRRYEDTLHAIGINDIDSNELPTLYQKLLPLIETKGYSYVASYLTIVSAWLHRNGLGLTKEIHYYTLLDEIKKKIGSRAAYSEKEADDMFFAARGNSELQKLLILMLYSGLRVSGAYPIYYNDISKVENVYTYEVISKAMRYNAIISPKAYARLIQLRAPGQSLVVQYDEGYSTSFDKLYRDAMNRAIRRDNLFYLRDGKSIFQSLRKTYAQKLLGSDLQPTDYTFKVLMGHIPKNSTATKYYVTPDGKSVPLDLIKRCAKAYETTSLMTMEIGLK